MIYLHSVLSLTPENCEDNGKYIGGSKRDAFPLDSFSWSGVTTLLLEILDPLLNEFSFFPGWSVQVDESVKFNSTTFNCGDKEYQDSNYYTDISDVDIAKTAGKVEQQLLTDFFKTWTFAGRPVSGWEFRPSLQNEKEKTLSCYFKRLKIRIERI